MGKKIQLYLLLILFSINIYGNEISNMRFGTDRVVFDIDSKEKINPLINYDEQNNLLFIEFENMQKNKNLENKKINGNYITKIEFFSMENITDLFVSLRPNIKYDTLILKNPTRFVIKFEKERKKKKIVIDAGHGGKDPGAIGYRKIHEKDLVLKFAKKLKTKLKNKYDILLTRDTDKFITLKNRSKIANDFGADLFISLHMNANRDKTASGTEVFYYSRKSSNYAKKIAKFENSVNEKYGIKEDYTELIVNDIFYHINQEKSMKLASSIEERIVNSTKFRKRGILGANFAVLRGSQAPAVLIELAFISNKSDAKKVSTEWYQNKMIDSIEKAINESFN
ncbi:MAG: hypothetical protein B6I28_01925 [Fusobacteriia bacterium 4572_132]|nr:MAG: hypothetical protein B6I28_01925 [Fusobacteriia bacterium 4572_132]